MKIQVNNTQINIEERGSGPTLLLIHGFPLNLMMWNPQIESLAADYRVIALDLRGHGLSPATMGPYSMDLLADDCAAVLKSLGVEEPAVVCGLSMGGYICFRFYDRHPQLVRGLILAATRAGGDTKQGKANRDKAISEINQGGIQSVVDNMLPILLAPDTYQENPGLVQQVKEIMAQNSSDGMVSALQGMKERPDSTNMLDKIEVPTLIVHGLEDQIISISESEIMHSGIQDSRLEKVPEAGHLLNLEQPEKFNQAVIEFIRSL